MEQSALTTANRESAIASKVTQSEGALSGAGLEDDPKSRRLPSHAGQWIVAWGTESPVPPRSGQALYIYCTRGLGSCSLDGHEVSVRPGNLLIVPAGIPYSCRADASDPWSIYWLIVQGGVTTRSLHALGLGNAPPVVNIGQDARLVDFVAKLLELLEASRDADSLPDHLSDASNVLRQVMAVLVRRQRESTAVAPDATQRVAASIEFMKRNLAHPIDVPLLSQMAKLSQSHYSALFKRQTGYSPVDYLLRLRVQAAAELLESTNHGIKTIAARLGYKDPLYFSRVFAGVQGVSPSEYRQGRRQLVVNRNRED